MRCDHVCNRAPLGSAERADSSRRGRTQPQRRRRTERKKGKSDRWRTRKRPRNGRTRCGLGCFRPDSVAESSRLCGACRLPNMSETASQRSLTQARRPEYQEKHLMPFDASNPWKILKEDPELSKKLDWCAQTFVCFAHWIAIALSYSLIGSALDEKASRRPPSCRWNFRCRNATQLSAAFDLFRLHSCAPKGSSRTFC